MPTRKPIPINEKFNRLTVIGAGDSKNGRTYYRCKLARRHNTEADAMKKTDGRYPYTYAADYIRMKAGDDYGSGLMSRAAASKCRSIISDSLGIDDEKVAEVLADRFISEYD